MQFSDICSKEQLIFIAKIAPNTSVKLTEIGSLLKLIKSTMKMA